MLLHIQYHQSYELLRIQCYLGFALSAYSAGPSRSRKSNH